MNNIVKVFIALFFVSFSQTKALAECAHPRDSWNHLDRATQADILQSLDYLDKAELPLGTSVAAYTDFHNASTASKISNKTHQEYVKKIISVFDREVSREEIEQSPFQTYGDEQIPGIYLLVDCNQEILGALLYKYQDGRDEDGNEGDINWSASARFDQDGELFVDEHGKPYDDLYFEWSGH